MRHNKRAALIVAIAAILVAASFFLAASIEGSNQTNLSSVVIHTSNGSVSVNVELATTPDQWAQGLMYRNSLAADSGMLFVFPNEAQRSFWMKNTLIPLDIIFISSNMTIVDVKKDFQPCIADPCPTYTSTGAAQYVLEVNAGFSDAHSVAEGDNVELKFPR